MIRTIAVLLTGSLIGFGAVHWLTAAPTGQDARVDLAIVDTARDSDRTDNASLLDNPLALLGAANESLADEVALEDEITRAAAISTSARGEALLQALLFRLVELDPNRAVRLVQQLGLGRELYRPVFRYWAELDPDGALAAVAEIEHPGLASALAVELLEVIGDNNENFDRIAALLPAGNRINFQLAALMRRVGRDPEAAFGSAIAITDRTVQDTALQRIAFSWGGQDGRAAMAQRHRIPDPAARAAYQNMVMTWWSRNDPAGAVDWIANSDDNLMSSMGALQTLANRAPAEVLAISERLPAGMRDSITTFAINVLADQDPAAALTAVVNLPPGVDRDEYLARTAGQLARRDPAQAVAWMRAQPQTPGLIATVGRALVEADFDLATELAVEYRDLPEMIESIAGSASRFPERLPTLVGALWAVEQGPSASMSSVIGAWADTSPIDALDWVLERTSVLDEATAGRLATRLASTDVDIAMEAMSRLPSEYQTDWFTSVATGYAQRDADGAASWVQQHRGRPGYASAAVAVIHRLAPIDPVSASAMVGELPGSAQQSVAATIAASWASQDAIAAEQWAASLGDPTARAAALGEVRAR